MRCSDTDIAAIMLGHMSHLKNDDYHVWILTGLGDKKIESELAQELCNFETLAVLKIQFNDKFARMDSCQNAISETLLLSDDGERLFAEDLEDAEIYREKFWELTTKIELKSQECTVQSDKESRKFKLPKIKL
ncbi:hypothetical protein TNCV_2455621 [Trichonephila clavipes]|nr:hypothetical protein TNCV_2455621 [Trichonephila clavipes]